MWVSADSFGVDARNSSRRRVFSAPRLTWNAVRQTHAAGSRTAAPRRRSCAYASATEIARDLSITGEGIDRAP